MALSSTNDWNLDRDPENVENFDDCSQSSLSAIVLPSLSTSEVVLLRPENKLVKRNLLTPQQQPLTVPQQSSLAVDDIDCKPESLHLEPFKDDQEEKSLFDANCTERGDVENSDPLRQQQQQQPLQAHSSVVSSNGPTFLQHSTINKSDADASTLPIKKQSNSVDTVMPISSLISDSDQSNFHPERCSGAPEVKLVHQLSNNSIASNISQPSSINDEEFWKFYGPHNFCDHHEDFFENRTHRIYVGRCGDQVRVFKPQAVDRQTESVLCTILGVYCDTFDSSVEEQVQNDSSGLLRDFIWPLSANRHEENLKTIRRLIQDNPVPDRLPYKDLPSDAQDWPSMPFSVRIKRKPKQEKQGVVNKKRKNCKKGKKQFGLVKKGTKSLDQLATNSKAIVSRVGRPSKKQKKRQQADGDDAIDMDKSVSDDEQYFSENSNPQNDFASLEQEVDKLKRLTENAEQELVTVATGLRRYKAARKRRLDSSEDPDSKRSATNKGVQPAHCPYCLQLFSATFNAKLHFNGRYKNNEKHISCKKRLEIGDKSLSPIICKSDCIICQLKNQHSTTTHDF